MSTIKRLEKEPYFIDHEVVLFYDRNVNKLRHYKIPLERLIKKIRLQIQTVSMGNQDILPIDRLVVTLLTTKTLWRQYSSE